MYDVNNDEQHFYVVEYKELLFILAVFIFIFFALFPKDLLKEQILSKDNDYELSMTYLKNLIIHDPKNEDLRFILAKKALQKGELNLANKLLSKLMYSKKEKIFIQSLLLNYNVLKQKYFLTDDKEQKKAIYKQLQKLYLKIYKNGLYNDNIQKGYNEAIFVNYTPARYLYVQQLIKKDPSNINYLKDGYVFALKENNIKLAQEYLTLLITYDSKNLIRWITDKYYLLSQQKRYAEAERLLKKAPKNKKFTKMMADLAMLQQKFKIASQKYLSLFYQSKNYNERKEYFKKIISLYITSKQYDSTVSFMKKYENEFIKDKKMRIFILSNYLAIGKTNEANRFSKKILKQGL